MHVAILHNAVDNDSSEADRDVLVQIEVVREALADLAHETTVLPCTLDLEAARRELEESRPAVVFNLVESLSGSDWLMSLAPLLLDAMRIPYTGAPSHAIVFTTHKVLAKQKLADSRIPTPGWIEQADSAAGSRPDGKSDENGAWIVKCECLHASFGLDEESISRGISRREAAQRLAARSRELGCRCFAERYIDGREFNLALLAGPNGPQVLPPAEIDFSAFPNDKPRIVGHRAKWEADSFEFNHTPHRFEFPESDRDILEELQSLARRCWQLFGLRGFARVDFRVDEDGRPWVLEVNPNPCLSPDAGFHTALAQASITFPEAIARILEDALNR